MKKMLVALTVLFASWLYAAPEDGVPKSEVDTAYEAANKAMVKGPKDISILAQATLKLPENFGFIPKQQAIDLLASMGNGMDDQVEGIVIPLGKVDQGFFVVSFNDSGYIKDDDALNWNPDDLLESLKEGTEMSNKERVAIGFPEVEVLGWITPPSYDLLTHKLVWSAELTQKDAPADEAHGINYNTYVLGREGYISLNLVTDSQNIDALKPVAHDLLGAMSFNTGKQYTDFNENTDRIAEYGLAALVAGVAAKKLGFFALMAAFVLKFAKFIGVAAVGLWYLLKGFFGRKQAE